MMEPIGNFAGRFGTSINLDETLIMKKQDRYFLLNKDLKKIATNDFFYAGTYLGKAKGGKFFPSFNLLSIIAQKKANKITIAKKAEWLFICGRDVFKQGITKVTGSTKKDGYVLVLNSYNECLGYGKLLCNLDKKKRGLAVENIMDVGDFLRREK